MIQKAGLKKCESWIIGNEISLPVCAPEPLCPQELKALSQITMNYKLPISVFNDKREALWENSMSHGDRKLFSDKQGEMFNSHS